MYSIGLIEFLGQIGTDTKEQREKLAEIIIKIRNQYMPKTSPEMIAKVIDELRSQNLIEFITAIMKGDLKRNIQSSAKTKDAK
jgi:hypothetical protein